LTAATHLLHCAFPLLGTEPALRIQLLAKAGNFIFRLPHRRDARMHRRVALDNFVRAESRGTENKTAIVASDDLEAHVRALEYDQFATVDALANVERARSGGYP